MQYFSEPFIQTTLQVFHVAHFCVQVPSSAGVESDDGYYTEGIVLGLFQVWQLYI